MRHVDHLTPEVADFLSAGTRTGKLGYTAADGRPLVAPVWFVVEDGALLFNTGKETAKGRAIRRDPRLVLCVDLEEPPYAYVQVQGTATVSEDPDELVRSATAIAGRYMGADRAARYGTSQCGARRAAGAPATDEGDRGVRRDRLTVRGHRAARSSRPTPAAGRRCQARRDWSLAGSPRSSSEAQPSASLLILPA